MTLDWKAPAVKLGPCEDQSKTQVANARRNLRASQRSHYQSRLEAERRRFAATIDYCEDARRVAAAREMLNAADIFERDATVSLTGLKKAIEQVKLAVFMIQYKAPRS